jgi:hypothetical protein
MVLDSSAKHSASLALEGLGYDDRKPAPTGEQSDGGSV